MPGREMHRRLYLLRLPYYKGLREARRSLVLTRDMKAGEVIRKEDLMPKRPGTGISPVYTDIVVGRKVVRDLEEDTILTWDMV